MAYTTIDDPSAYFQTTLYTGNGGTQTITHGGNSNLQANMIWVKSRGNNNRHQISNTVHGIGKVLETNDSGGENTLTNGVTSIGANNFAIGSNSYYNDNTISFVSWNWKDTSAAGFDICNWDGNATNRTISHDLGVVPKTIIVKNMGSDLSWRVYHAGNTAAPETDHLKLDSTSATADDDSMWNDTAPTSSVFSLKTSTSTNGNGSNYVGYVFGDVQGYQKCGSYVGTGSDVFVYTGFKVGWLLVKNADNTNGWLVIDTKRSPGNPQGKYQYADAFSAEGTVTYGEFYSNGFGWKGTGSVAVNQSDETFVYIAIAENPLVTSTGVPALAR
tara:strand:+ start:1926 stop:2915 length:990 start_codon:yes stop_codon:yes gene_type:complete